MTLTIPNFNADSEARLAACAAAWKLRADAACAAHPLTAEQVNDADVRRIRRGSADHDLTHKICYLALEGVGDDRIAARTTIASMLHMERIGRIMSGMDPIAGVSYRITLLEDPSRWSSLVFATRSAAFDEIRDRRGWAWMVNAGDILVSLDDRDRRGFKMSPSAMLLEKAFTPALIIEIVE